MSLQFLKYKHVLRENKLPALENLLSKGYQIQLTFRETDEEGNRYRIIIYEVASLTYFLAGISHISSSFIDRRCPGTQLTYAQLDGFFNDISEISTECPFEKQDAALFASEPTGVDWSMLVAFLAEKGKVDTREDWHKGRSDKVFSHSLKITWVDGLEMAGEEPIEALEHDDPPIRSLRKRLLALAGIPDPGNIFDYVLE